MILVLPTLAVLFYLLCVAAWRLPDWIDEHLSKEESDRIFYRELKPGAFVSLPDHDFCVFHPETGESQIVKKPSLDSAAFLRILGPSTTENYTRVMLVNVRTGNETGPVEINDFILRVRPMPVAIFLGFLALPKIARRHFRGS
jgi:hypothetical protein